MGRQTKITKENAAVLLQFLMRGPSSAQELFSALNLSQASLSRLLKLVEKNLVHVGAARSTRYASLRDIRGVGSQFPVFQVDKFGLCSRYGELISVQPRGFVLIPKDKAPSQIFQDIPFYLFDVAPQGFLGRSFSGRHRELNLPYRLIDWGQEDYVEAFVRRGEDLSGNLLIGRESFERYQRDRLTPLPTYTSVTKADHYLSEAERALDGASPGSSAGGDQPKFTSVFKEGGKVRHVIVKFSPTDNDTVGVRWRDLLICESIALEILTQAEIPAAEAQIYEKGRRVFLEVSRFDREGVGGRIGIISLAALDDEWFGSRDDWARASLRLVKRKSLSLDDARKMRLLYSFGGLIANSDMHFGNLSFYWELGSEKVSLAPVYDMLPMLYAPVQGQLTNQAFKPALAHPDALEEWALALPLAMKFWKTVSLDSRISAPFRKIARENLALLGKLG